MNQYQEQDKKYQHLIVAFIQPNTIVVKTMQGTQLTSITCSENLIDFTQALNADDAYFGALSDLGNFFFYHYTLIDSKARLLKY